MVDVDGTSFPLIRRSAPPRPFHGPITSALSGSPSGTSSHRTPKDWRVVPKATRSYFSAVVWAIHCSTGPLVMEAAFRSGWEAASSRRFGGLWDTGSLLMRTCLVCLSEIVEACRGNWEMSTGVRNWDWLRHWQQICGGLDEDCKRVLGSRLNIFSESEEDHASAFCVCRYYRGTYGVSLPLLLLGCCSNKLTMSAIAELVTYVVAHLCMQEWAWWWHSTIMRRRRRPLVFTGYSDTGTSCDSTERKHRTFCRTHIISGPNHSACYGLAPISFTMSTLATNIILHPRVNRSLAILATTVGRDKVRR